MAVKRRIIGGGAVCLLVALGGLLYSRLAARSLTLMLDDGVMTCGFSGNPAVLPGSSEEISFHPAGLALQAQGRVVFSGQVDGVKCYRSSERRWGIPGGDFIQVMFPPARFDATVERWRQIYQQLGASPHDLQALDEWKKEVTEAERASLSPRDIWLQGFFSIPGTNIGVYAQSIPKSSDLPLVYSSLLSIFWKEPIAHP
jgi:hypothetical protein